MKADLVVPLTQADDLQAPFIALKSLFLLGGAIGVGLARLVQAPAAIHGPRLVDEPFGAAFGCSLAAVRGFKGLRRA